jgi:hypothetical protein
MKRSGTRRHTKGRRHTRKAGRHGALSVEALHASFEKMDARLRGAVESGVTDSELGRAVERAWSSSFQKELSAPAVQGLVAHYRGLYGGSRKGRRTRRAQRGQHGGMAPLSWTMGQGTTGTVWGRFPDDFSTSAQAVRSLDMTRFNENSVSRSCDSTGGRDTLASQKGGGIIDNLWNLHAPMSVPRNPIETAVTTLQGAPVMNPPADPTATTWRMAVATPTPFDSSAISSLSGLAPVFKGY